MPTREVEEQFVRDFARLTPQQRQAFLAALREFIQDCDSGDFRASLHVHPMRGHAGIWEMAWEGNDGRATFAWGPTRLPGKRHVIWRRVGGHEIYNNP
ncbi:MAG TPA: hypothetical protein VN837_03010 [Chloroflexota bacterium]|nr:hypothetical protein [Chloroflexota bacterium]